jgi:hypothetical protein
VFTAEASEIARHVPGEWMILRARPGFRKPFADLTPATCARDAQMKSLI